MPKGGTLLFWGLLAAWLFVIMQPGQRMSELSEKLGGWYQQGYEKDGRYFVGDNHRNGPAGGVVYTEVSKADWEKLKYWVKLHWLGSLALIPTALFVFIFQKELGLRNRRLPYR